MWSKLRIPLLVLVSVAAGAGGVVLYNHLSNKPTDDESAGKALTLESKSADEHFDSILKDQEKLFKNFDSMFNDDFFRHDDPFTEMRKFRERLHKEFRPKRDSFFSSPFDSWYEEKFGGGGVEEITKREDDKYVYYDIKLPNIEGSSVKTNVENGYLTITGEVKKSTSQEKEGKFRSLYQSSFRRTFPLPDNVDGDKMEMESQKDKLVLRFPKRELFKK